MSVRVTGGAALWLAAALSCSSSAAPSSSNSPAGSGATPPAAGINGPAQAGGGRAAAPSAWSVAQAGVSGASTASSSAGQGGATIVDAGMPSCRIPDNLMLIDTDGADAGLDPTCQNVPRKIIANNCIGGICHDSSGLPAGNLDLMAPCVADRLVNVMSSCMGMQLIDTADPERSFLLDKINSQTPKCGVSMPDRGHLPPDELACMNAWVRAVIRAASP